MLPLLPPNPKILPEFLDLGRVFRPIRPAQVTFAIGARRAAIGFLKGCVEVRRRVEACLEGHINDLRVRRHEESLRMRQSMLHQIGHDRDSEGLVEDMRSVVRVQTDRARDLPHSEWLSVVCGHVGSDGFNLISSTLWQ